MINPKLLAISYVLLLSMVTINPLLGQQQSDKKRASVRFIARSTAVRGTYGSNEDIYLVEIGTQGKDLIYAKLIDSYFNLFPPLPWRILTSKAPVLMRIVRDQECDVRLQEMPIRSAPGDRSTILPVPLHYESEEPASIPVDKLLPCYRTEGKRFF